MPSSNATPASEPRWSRIRSGVADYERRIGPIAARRTTRTAALHAFTRAFWWYVWTESFQRRWLWVKAFGVIPVPVRVRDMRPVFVEVFGEVPPCPVP